VVERETSSEGKKVTVASVLARNSRVAYRSVISALACLPRKVPVARTERIAAALASCTELESRVQNVGSAVSKYSSTRSIVIDRDRTIVGR